MTTRKLNECNRCGAPTELVAYDYGDGIGTPWCGPCRQQVRSGADSWVWTKIAWGNGPRSGKTSKAKGK